jgi:FG-GAP-like repeat
VGVRQALSVSVAAFTFLMLVEPARAWKNTGFHNYELRPTAHEPQSVAVGDLTSDGRVDVLLVTTEHYTDQIVLYLYAQLGNGALAPPVEVKAPHSSGPHAPGVALGDLDADGRMEAVVGGRHVTIFRQFAGSLIAAEQASPAWPTHATQLAIGDLDSDGHTDIVYAGQRQAEPGSTGSVLVALLNGGDHFEAKLLLDDYIPGDIEVGDVTGDGRVDVVTTDWRGDPSGTLTLLEQRRSGQYRRRELKVHSAELGVGSLALADMTQDGLTDIVFTGDGIGVLAQSPGGAYSRSRIYPRLHGESVMAAADMNLDRRTDLVFLQPGWKRLGLRTQTPDSQLGPERDFNMAYGEHRLMGLALGDYTGDGLVDVAVANRPGGYVGEDPEKGLILLVQGQLQPPEDRPKAWILGGPAYRTNAATVTFEFVSSEREQRFVCELDGREVAPCASPMTFSFAESGSHRFLVTPLDAATQVAGAPVEWEWSFDPGFDEGELRIREGPHVGPDGAASPPEPRPPAAPAPPPLPPPAPIQPVSPLDPGTPAPPAPEPAHQTGPQEQSSRGIGRQERVLATWAVVRGPGRVGRGGVAFVPVSCRPGDGRPCRGRLALVRSRKLFGSAAFALPERTHRIVRIRLRANAMRRLSRRRGITVRAVISSPGRATLSRPLRLRLG